MAECRQGRTEDLEAERVVEGWEAGLAACAAPCFQNDYSLNHRVDWCKTFYSTSGKSCLSTPDGQH